MPIRAERMGLYPGGSIRSPEWQAIRARIQARAGNRCEECGVENYALGGRSPEGVFHKAFPLGERLSGLRWPEPGMWAACSGYDFPRRIIRIVCTVAHLDGDETNNADENLRFLCQRCHNRHDAASRARNAAATRRRANAAGDLFEDGGSA